MGRKKSKSKRRKPKNQEETPTAVASSSAPPQPPSPTPSLPLPPWIELPRDVTANILQRVGAVEILESAQKVCTTWRSVCQDPAMWRVIDMKTPGDMFEQIPNMCRLAVDRSQGQLIDLSLDYFGDDELLNYIVERSSTLRRLSLNSCYQITGEGLAEAVKRLPNLEELHLVVMPSVQAADVEAIGTSCPMLKSFTLNERSCKHLLPEFPLDDVFMEGLNSNKYALAIAKTMPNLHHLRLFADCMKNEGLQAILDGCPHLESLDIRQCFDLDLRGDLGKRCSEQIKDLKLPSDSISDVEWLVGGSSVGWGADQLSDSDFSDIYSLDCFDDYGYYDDFEYYDYDDYTNPFAAEYFRDEGRPPWVFGHDYL